MSRPNDSLLVPLNGLKETPKIQEMDAAKVAKQPRSRRTQWKQWAACISATLSMVAAGTVYGWTTTMQKRLNHIADDLPFRIEADESSWVVSVTVIGSMIGPFYGAYVAASYGRKLCLLATAAFYVTGWLLVIFAQAAWYLYLSRIILGIGVGMSYTANPMYVSEVADVNIRGALSTLIAVNVFTGSLLACSVGPWVAYRVLGVVMLAVPVLFLASFVWFPESPYYLVSKGRSAEALRALRFFKGLGDEAELRQELELVRRNIGEQASSGQSSADELKFKFSDFLLLMKTNNRRALLIVMALILGQQLSGNFSTMQYLETMFETADSAVDSHVATIIVLAVGLVSGATCTLMVEGAGRRPLLIFSGFGCAVVLGVLGAYLAVDHAPKDNVNSAINLLPVLDVIVFQVVYQIGLGTMPNLLIGELFPTNVKGIAGAIVTVFDGLTGFVVSKMFEVIFTNVGPHVPYLFFSASCTILFVFVYAFVPETKRKTFNEIQDILAELKPFEQSAFSASCWRLCARGAGKPAAVHASPGKVKAEEA
ncbi:facilitated trehalose transporter Tret1-like isoform X2 [Phymastichus coffea]|uniref:facilitated trehalose transporter Tret1-like isoform X2 n=1 Tax=Phymastichus coffea TaxID=108790 RepID=UPI00273BB6F7|nr:facilitated trehalose transporter Tret1-like isoform X2 [Phymastichus coffea]